MAGNAWKYSHKLDDVDMEFLQHDFITIKQGVNYYGFSERPFLRMAKEAGALHWHYRSLMTWYVWSMDCLSSNQENRAKGRSVPHIRSEKPSEQRYVRILMQ